jgi:DNA-directed RNA polymerase specialized sigma subunit
MAENLSKDVVTSHPANQHNPNEKPKEIGNGKGLTEATKSLLVSGLIQPWQASVRDRIALTTILALPEVNACDNATIPAGAPSWAGGKDKSVSTRAKKTWTTDELIDFYEDGFLTGHLLPWEAALKYDLHSSRILSLLARLGEDIASLAPSPEWIQPWAQYGNPTSPAENKKTEVQRLLPLDAPSPAPTQAQPQPQTPNQNEWTEVESSDLRHYWVLPLLSLGQVAGFLGKTEESVKTMAKSLHLGRRPRAIAAEADWCGINWDFEVEGLNDPRHLEPTLQRMVAETSATRFSLLYEKLEGLPQDSSDYRRIQRELDKILILHSRIFSKYLANRSRKYKFLGTSAWQVQKDLEQAGQAAIFECLRRWHPNRKIRFSRGAVNIAINREMLAWIEQQRLVDLPDKVRSVARKLKQAHDRGDWEAEVERLKAENGENCVREASKHTNSYAFLPTVQLVEELGDEESEGGRITGGAAECAEDFSAFCLPENDTDLSSLLLEACQTIPAPERRAVLAYHGINEDGTHGPQQTLEEIGARENVTKERIRQRIMKGKQRMRRWLERKNIRNVGDALTAV